MRIQPLRSAGSFLPVFLAYMVGHFFRSNGLSGTDRKQVFATRDCNLALAVDNIDFSIGSSGEDAIRLRESLARLPIIIEENPNTGYDKLFMSLSSRNNAKKTQMGSHPRERTQKGSWKTPFPCNPSFTIDRFMNKTVHTHFNENYGWSNTTEAWYDNPLVDWTIAKVNFDFCQDTMLINTMKTGTTMNHVKGMPEGGGGTGYDFVRECILQGEPKITAAEKTSKGYQVMWAHNLITRNRWKTADQNGARQFREQKSENLLTSAWFPAEHVYFWDYENEVRITDPWTDDSLIECTGSGACDFPAGADVLNTKKCQCKLRPGLEDFVKRMDDFLSVGNARNAWSGGLFGTYWLHIGNGMFYALIICGSLYHPLPVLWGWFINRWVLGLLMLRNWRVYYQIRMQLAERTARDYCWGRNIAFENRTWGPTVAWPFNQFRYTIQIPFYGAYHTRAHMRNNDNYASTQEYVYGDPNSSIPGSQIQPYLPNFYCDWSFSWGVDADKIKMIFWFFVPIVYMFLMDGSQPAVKNQKYDRTRKFYPSNFRLIMLDKWFVKLALAWTMVFGLATYATLSFYGWVTDNAVLFNNDVNPWRPKSGWWILDIGQGNASLSGGVTALILTLRVSDIFLFTSVEAVKGKISNKLEMAAEGRGKTIISLGPFVAYSLGWSCAIFIIVYLGCNYDVPMGTTRKRNVSTGEYYGRQIPLVYNICHAQFYCMAIFFTGTSSTYIVVTIICARVLRELQNIAGQADHLTFGFLRWSGVVFLLTLTGSTAYYVGSCWVTGFNVVTKYYFAKKYGEVPCDDPAYGNHSLPTDGSGIGENGCRVDTRFSQAYRPAYHGIYERIGNAHAIASNFTGSLRAPFLEAPSCARGMRNHGFPWLMSRDESPLMQIANRISDFYTQRVYDKTCAAGKCVRVGRREIYDVDSEVAGNYTYLENTAYNFPPPQYGVNMFLFMYSTMQIITTSGLGEIPPSSIVEKFFYIVFCFVGIVIVQTKLINVLCSFVMTSVSEKADYLRNAVGCLFSHPSAANLHRIEHTQSILWRHWSCWSGIMPLNPASPDLDVLSENIRTEIKYFVLSRMLSERKSTMLHYLKSPQLKNVASQLEYHIVQQDDLILNSLETQNFVLIVHSGCLQMVDRNHQVIGELQRSRVHYELECFLGSQPTTHLKCYSNYAEYIIIPRDHFVTCIESCTDLNQLLHDTVLKNRRRKHLMRQSDSSSISFAASGALGLQGLCTPVLSQTETTLPKLSDVQAYAMETGTFRHHPDSIMKLATADANTGQLIEISSTVYLHYLEVAESAYKRTESRLGQAHVDVHEAHLHHDESEERETRFTKARTDGIAFLSNAPDAINARAAMAAELSGQREAFTCMAQQRMSKMKARQSTQSLGAFDSTVSQEAFQRDDYQTADLTKDLHTMGKDGITDNTLWVKIWGTFNSFHCICAIFIVSNQWAFYNTGNLEAGYWGIHLLLVDSVAIINVFLTLSLPFLDEDNIYQWDVIEHFKRKGWKEQLRLACGVLPLDLVFGVCFANADVAVGTYHFWRLLRIVYNITEANLYWRQQQAKLFNKTSILFMVYGLPMVATVQLMGAIGYRVVCHYDANSELGKRVWMEPGTFCYPGSWGWQEFNEDTDTPNMSNWHRAITTFYWKTKIFSTFNHGNIIPSYYGTHLLMTLEMFLGVMFLTTTTAIVTAVVMLNTRMELLADFSAHWNTVKSALIDAKCCQVVLHTKKQIFMRYHGLAVPGVFTAEDNLMPVDRAIVKNDINGSVLRYIPVFCELPSTLRMKVAMVAHGYLYSRGQIVINAGEAIDHLYFIRYGLVRVESADGAVLGYLESGQSFNFLEMCAGAQSRYTLVCETSCEMVDWKLKDLTELFSHFSPWSPWDMLKSKCADKLNSLQITPRTIDVAALKASAQVHANEFLVKEGLSADGGEAIDATKGDGFKWQIINVTRILLHLICAAVVCGFCYSNPISWAPLILFDGAAMYNMYVNMNLVRANPQTNYPVTNSAWCKKFYIDNCLVNDILTSVLPLLIDLVTGFNNPVSVFLRFWQYRHIMDFFTFINDSIDINAIYNAFRSMFRSISWVAFGTVASIKFSVFEAKLMDAADTVTLATNIVVPANSWMAQAHDAVLGDDVFTACDVSNSLHNAIISFWYHADTASGTGSGILMAPKASYEQFWDLMFQFIGWYTNVMIAANFISYAEINDQVRQQAENTYYRITHFFRSSGDVCTNAVVKTIMKSLKVTYREKSGVYDRVVYNGLPHCCVKDVVSERYGDVFKMNFFSDPATQEFLIRRVAPYVTILSTTSDTYVLENDQLTEHAFFVSSGEYSLIDSEWNRTLLPRGAHYIPGPKSTHQFISRCDGQLLCVPLSKLKMLRGFKPPQTITRARTVLLNRKISAHYEFERKTVIAGVFSFFFSTFYFFYWDRYADPDNNNQVYKFYDCSGFESSDCSSWSPRDYVSAQGWLMLMTYSPLLTLAMCCDIWLFVWVYFHIIRNKQKQGKSLFDKESYNREELLYLIAAVPAPFHVKWIIRTLWFYIEHVYTYEREKDDITYDMYTIRIIKFGFFWALFGGVHLIGCFTILYMCPGGLCDGNSMAREYLELMKKVPINPFDMDACMAEKNSTAICGADEAANPHHYVHNTIEDDSLDYHRYSISDSSTLIDTYYTTLDTFAATGEASIRPHQPFIIFLRACTCIVGRITMGLVLGISRDITECAEEGLIAGYVAGRTRVRAVLEQFKVSLRKEQYILGYIDAVYRRTLYFDIIAAIDDMHVSPAVRRDLAYDMYGRHIEKTAAFEGLSLSAIKEISVNACTQEDYFAGHIIQDHGMPINDSYVMRLGACTIGTRRVKIQGEAMYQHHMGEQGAIAESRVIAFTHCEIIRVNYEATMRILQWYPDDKHRFRTNVQTMVKAHSIKK